MFGRSSLLAAAAGAVVVVVAVASPAAAVVAPSAAACSSVVAGSAAAGSAAAAEAVAAPAGGCEGRPLPCGGGIADMIADEQPLSMKASGNRVREMPQMLDGCRSDGRRDRFLGGPPLTRGSRDWLYR